MERVSAGKGEEFKNLGEFFHKASKQRGIHTIIVLMGTLKKGFMGSVVRYAGKEDKKSDVFLSALRLVCEQSKILEEFTRENSRNSTSSVLENPLEVFDKKGLRDKVLHVDFGNGQQEYASFKEILNQVMHSESHSQGTFCTFLY